VVGKKKRDGEEDKVARLRLDGEAVQTKKRPHVTKTMPFFFTIRFFKVLFKITLKVDLFEDRGVLHEH
jgi:hypothetical protein